MAAWGDPVDPGYIDFKEGFARYLNGDARTRWHVPRTEWYLYPVATWALEEIPVPATPSGAKWDWDKSAQRIQWVPPPPHQLPDLYRKVSAAHDKIDDRYAAAVWSPRDGSWRLARQLASPRPSEGPIGPGDSRLSKLPKAALERIARIDEAEQLDLITRDQAARLRLEVVEEYT